MNTKQSMFGSKNSVAKLENVLTPKIKTPKTIYNVKSKIPVLKEKLFDTNFYKSPKPIYYFGNSKIPRVLDSNEQIDDIIKIKTFMKAPEIVKNAEISLSWLAFNGIQPEDMMDYVLKYYKQYALRYGEDKRIVIVTEKKSYTLTRQNFKKLLDADFLKFHTVEASSGEYSDYEFYQSFLEGDIIKFAFVEKSHKYENKTGAFFNYFLNIETMDLKKCGIYHNIVEFEEEEYKVCLIKALKEGGLSKQKIELLKSFVKNAEIPKCKFDEICERLDITIKIYFLNKKIQTYGKNETEIYELCLVENHYFLNYDISEYQNFLFTEYGINKKSKQNRFKYTSYNLIKLLLSDKKFLTKITFNDLEETVYYKKVEETIGELTVELKYNLVEKETNIPDQEKTIVNVYYDFETRTEINTLEHIPYLVHCIHEWEGKTIKKSFKNVDCGLSMLKHLNNTYSEIVKKNKNIIFQLIAHNAGAYDKYFLIKYLTEYKELLRNGRMISAKGKFNNLSIRLKDSYNLISEPLRNFAKMFNLEVHKEVMPYEFYNRTNNILDYIDVKMEDVIPYLKNEMDIKIFQNNIIKWNLRDNTTGLIDMMEYSNRYCMIDVEVLKQGYEKFKSWILDLESPNGKKLNLNIDNILTSSALGNKYALLSGCFKNIYKMKGISQQFIQKTVVGGRVMLKRNQKLIRKAYKKDNGEINYIADFDAVSLYPSAIVRMDGFLQGTPKLINANANASISFNDIKNYDGYFVEIKIKQINKRRDFPLFTFKDGLNNRIFTDDITLLQNKSLFVDKTTLEDYIRFYDMNPETDIEIIRGYYFNEGFNTKIRPTMNYLFEKRKQLKKDKNPAEKIYKIILLSIYGKTLLKEQESEVKYIKKDRWNCYLSKNYDRIICFTEVEGCNIMRVEERISISNHENECQIGTTILSMSKRLMNEVMTLAEDIGCELFYQDTDSMHLYDDDIEKISNEYFKLYDRKLIGDALGQFHSDFEIKGCDNTKSKCFIGLGKKSYIDELIGWDKNDNEVIDYHIRMKGINKCAIDYEVNELKNFDSYLHLYERLFESLEVDFDMTGGGKMLRFQKNKNQTIQSIRKFNRKVRF